MSDSENIQRRLANFFPGFDVIVLFQPKVDLVSITLEKSSNGQSVAHVSADTRKKVMTISIVQNLLNQLEDLDETELQDRVSPAIGLLYGSLKVLLPLGVSVE